MKIGYPCINLSLLCRSSRTFRLASYSDERLKETLQGNLACLLKILEYNAQKGLLFFRITSDLVPFASHPVCTFPWQDFFVDEFKMLGEYIKLHKMRVSMHPDQFVLINSLDKEIFRRSIKELLYQAEVLDLLGTDRTAKIQIHAGGVYGDKQKSMKRFVDRYNSLPEKIKKRLVIENDERLFDLDDCLDIQKMTGIPVVFDAFHFSCNNRGEKLKTAVSKAANTWTDRDGLLIVDYSSQEPDKRTGKHSNTLNVPDFRKFIKAIEGHELDIMLEIKDKEKSAIRALHILSQAKRL